MSARSWLYLFLLLALVPLKQASGTGSHPPLTANNAAHIQQIAVVGHGYLNDVAWSPDAHSIAVASDLGIWVFDANLSDGYLIDDVTDSIVVLDFNQDGTILGAGDASGNVYFFDTTQASPVSYTHLTLPTN